MTWILTTFIATYASIRFSVTSSKPHDSPSQANRMLPYHPDESGSAASVVDLVPTIFGAEWLDQ